jgi:large subunit ribosomal protein L22
MTATDHKTNERPGVRAVLRDARFSAYKAREVLDLVRGKPVGEARTILQFSERSCARDIAKVLDSAVANAANNNDIPPEELFVSACFADEGATLKRWRPRARGRATRIRKRTCHITIIVGRYSVEELDRLRERQARTGAPARDAASARARRVARSRQSAAVEEAEEARAAGATDAEVEDVVDEAAAEEVATGTFAEDAEDAGLADGTTEADGDNEGTDADGGEGAEAEAAAEKDED